MIDSFIKRSARLAPRMVLRRQPGIAAVFAREYGRDVNMPIPEDKENLVDDARPSDLRRPADVDFDIPESDSRRQHMAERRVRSAHEDLSSDRLDDPITVFEDEFVNKDEKFAVRNNGGEKHVKNSGRH